MPLRQYLDAASVCLNVHNPSTSFYQEILFKHAKRRVRPQRIDDPKKRCYAFFGPRTTLREVPPIDIFEFVEF